MVSVHILILAEGRNAERIQAAAEQVAPEDSVESYSAAQGLVQRLSEPVDTQCITILVPASRQDLADLVNYENTLSRTRIVLVLPDDEEATVSLGHQLRPRVVLHSPDFLEYLTPVIARMKAHRLRTPDLNPQGGHVPGATKLRGWTRKEAQ